MRVSQSNSRFNALVTLVVTIYSVRIPVAFGKHASKSMGRPLAVMAQLRRSVVEVKAGDNCLAHNLIQAIAKADKDPNYLSYRHGNKIRPVVRTLLESTGIEFCGGGEIV